MAKVLVVITNDTYVRNYLRTDALSELRNAHDVYLTADRTLSLGTELEGAEGFIGFYDLDQAMEKKHQFLFNLMMWRHRNKSRTFFYRWLRNSNWHLIRRDGSPALRLLSYLHWFGAALLNRRGLRIPLLANRVTFPLVSALVKIALEPNESLRTVLESQAFDVIVFPSAAFDSVSVDLVALGQELKIPTVCLIDNWDNLSSKTVFWRKPDHLGVWGPQTKAQAIDIHGFKSDQVHLIGTPRFDSYFFARENPPPAPYPFPYGLYVGSAMPFDDIGTLRSIDAIIASSDSFSPNFRIIYRPHPWQHKRNSDSQFRPEEFSRVVLDTQFEVAFGEGRTPGKTDLGFQPDLDYYPGLLLSSRFVLGPLTTMLFEGALCLRPVVALSYFDGYHVNTSKRYFSHFQGMERVPGFSFCEDPTELESGIEAAATRETPCAKDSDNETVHFLYRDSFQYAKRVLDLVTHACATK